MLVVNWRPKEADRLQREKRLLTLHLHDDCYFVIAHKDIIGTSQGRFFKGKLNAVK